MNTAPIMEEEDEEEGGAIAYTEVDKSIDDEIDNIIRHYAGNTVDTATKLKQKEVLTAQNRAKQRLKLSKKKEEIAKLKEAKKEKEERVKKKKELNKKRKREIQTMHQKKRKRMDSLKRGQDEEAKEERRDAQTAAHDDEGLGEVEPDRGAPGDMNIHAQIDQEDESRKYSTLSHAPKSQMQHEDSDGLDTAGLKKQNTDSGRTRYDNFEDEEEDDYDGIEDYEQDFNAEEEDEGMDLDVNDSLMFLHNDK